MTNRLIHTIKYKNPSFYNGYLYKTYLFYGED